MRSQMNVTLALGFFILALASCAEPASIHTRDASPSSSPEEELLPFSPHVVYAKKWSEIIIHSNFAKTIITLGAHLSTSRNACGREAYGPIPLGEWNDLAEATNQIAESSLGHESCMEESQELDQNGYIKKHVDGSVQLKLENSPVIDLFTAKNGMICTLIKDTSLAQRLLSQLNRQVIRADQEDCPNGWGSN